MQRAGDEIHRLDLDARQRTPDRRQALVLGVPEPGDRDGGAGLGETVRHLHVAPPANPPDELVRHGTTGHDPRPQRRKMRAVEARRSHQQVEHRRHAVEHGDRVGLEELHRALGVELLLHHDRRARGHRPNDDRDPENRKQRDGHQDAIRRRHLERLARSHRRLDDRPMRQADALGLPHGARRVQDREIAVVRHLIE